MTAGGMIAICAIMVCGALVGIALPTLFNEVISVNVGLQSDFITEKSTNYYNTLNSLINFLPIIIIFGCTAWGIVHSIENKRVEQ